MSGTGKREVEQVMCSCGEMFTTPQALWDHHATEQEAIVADLQVLALRRDWRSLAIELGDALARCELLTFEERYPWSPPMRLTKTDAELAIAKLKAALEAKP